MKPSTTSIRLALLITVLICRPGAARAQVQLEGRTLETAKHRITLDDSGLPAQIVVKTAPSELPLPLRSTDAEAGAAELQRIGRGPQLRGPVRLQATVGGQVLVAQPTAPAKPTVEDDAVSCDAEWQAGDLQGKLRVRYAADGAMTAEVTYGGQDVNVEKLELALELAGDWSTVVTGPPTAAYALSAREGVAWQNLADEGDAARPSYPGILKHCFLGSGDRGLTWLAADAAGFRIDDRQPTVVVERNEAGQLTWRLAIVNTPTRVGKASTAKFALLVHPARSKAAGRRQAQWKPWSGEPMTPGLAVEARKPGLEMVRADSATVHEGNVQRALLAGPAGGDANSGAATLADTFPMDLFRYLAATHTGLSVQLRTNAAQLVTPGASPGCDRIAIGRALLHDVGVDVTRLTHRADAANILRALDRFGFFRDDGNMEFLPYWRTGDIVRFGEVFDADGAFEVTADNPTARVYVSVYLRPTARKSNRFQALFVIVNESDKPVREQLYVLRPGRLFGGPNVLTAPIIIKQWDFSAIPEDSDWGRRAMTGSAVKGRGPKVFLQDIEDKGFMRARNIGDGGEIYGNLFVPARGVRLLYGTGAR